MKRVVLGSFGYRDSDWIDPPEDDYEAVDDEVQITLDGDIIVIDEDGELIEIKTEFEDYGEYGETIFDAQDLSEAVYEQIDSVLPEDIKPGEYKVYGNIAIPFTVFTPIITPFQRRYMVEEPEVEIERHTSSASISDFKLELA